LRRAGFRGRPVVRAPPGAAVRLRGGAALLRTDVTGSSGGAEEPGGAVCRHSPTPPRGPANGFATAQVLIWPERVARSNFFKFFYFFEFVFVSRFDEGHSQDTVDIRC
jgi:hypothetical protein